MKSVDYASRMQRRHRRSVMKSLRSRLFIASSLLVSFAVLAAEPAPPKYRVFLAGDSTMQASSGYGGALCQRFSAEVACSNRGIGGRSSKSYRVDGYWDKLMASMSESAGEERNYVLIQLGHNDGSDIPARHTELPEYEANMRAYVAEVRKMGGVPILITPVTDRWFENWKLKESFKPWADITRKIANDEGIVLIDLFVQSRAAVEAMGPSQAALLAPEEPPPEVRVAARQGNTIRANKRGGKWDHVHLGQRGADLFSAMVADGLRQQVPDLGVYLTNGD